ncbi:MAG: EF-hand domain-containing protein [Uliginosibacterium sp.]|nr:EF-hand domain-containing protein [Uliginosibacterium sp.]
MDYNHDGAIDARERPIPELAAVFNTLDKNKDGVLSEPEFKTASKPLG